MVRAVTGNVNLSNKKGKQDAFDKAADFLASKSNPLNRAFSAIPEVVRAPIRGTFDILDLPRAAIMSTAKETRDLFTGKGFSPADLIEQTRKNISAIEALGLDRFGTFGKIGGLGLDLAVGVKTAPNIRTVQAGASRFAKGTRVGGVTRAVETAERAILPRLEELGVVGTGAREITPLEARAILTSSKDAAREAELLAALSPDAQAVLAREMGGMLGSTAGDAKLKAALDTAAKFATGRNVPLAEQIAVTGQVPRLAIGRMTIGGTEQAAETIGRLKDLVKPALVKKVTRPLDGPTQTFVQRLDSFGRTSSRIRASALVALETGDAAPFLHELNTTAARSLGVGAKTRYAASLNNTLREDITELTGQTKMNKALEALRRSPDRGANEALAWANGAPTNETWLTALLDKTWQRIRIDNADLELSNPQMVDSLRRQLATNIQSYYDDVAKAQTYGPQAARVKLGLAAQTDVLTSVVVPWLDNVAVLSAFKELSTPENIARIAMSGVVNRRVQVANPITGEAVIDPRTGKPKTVLIRQEIPDLRSTEEFIRDAMRARETYRDKLFTSKTLASLLGRSTPRPGEAIEAVIDGVKITNAGPGLRGRVDSLARQAKLTAPERARIANAVRQGTAVQIKRELYDPLQLKYESLANEWSKVSAAEETHKRILETIAAKGGSQVSKKKPPRAPTAFERKMTGKSNRLAQEKADAAKRMTTAQKQFEAAEEQLKIASREIPADVATTVGQPGLAGVEARQRALTDAAKRSIEAERRNIITRLEADVLAARTATKTAKGVYRGTGKLAYESLNSPFSSAEAKMRKILDDAGDADEAFINATAASMWDGVVRWGRYNLMDKETFQRIFATFGSTDDIGKFTRHVQGITNIFRSSAIASFGFSNRNFVGALLNNYAHGVSLAKHRWAAKTGAKYMKDIDREIAAARAAGVPNPEIVAAQKVLETAPQELRTFVSRMGDAQHAGSRGLEINQFAATPIERGSQFIQQALDRQGLSARGIITGTMNESVKVEFVVRLAAFKQFLDEGMTVNGAWARVQRIHFDYTDLSHFDISGKRIMPFWTWTTRNLPAQAELLVQNRGIGRTLDMATLNSQESDGTVPPWLIGSGFSLGGGLTLDLSGAPSTDLLSTLHSNYSLGELGRSMLGQSLGPTVKVPLEIATGREFVTGRPLGGGGGLPGAAWRTATNIVPGVGQVARALPVLGLPGAESKSAPSSLALKIANVLGNPTPFREFR